MDKVLIFLIIALIAQVAVSKSLRHKRQSDDEDENNLEDRYGWNRRPQQWGNQNQWGNQGQGQGQWGNQGQNQWGNQGQNQWDNQGQDQWGNQGQNQWGNTNQGRPNQNGNQGQGQFPNQNGQNGQNPQPTPAPSGSTTQSPQAAACIAACPVTPEYNPVCGSDGTTYSNDGRLSCAQSCGLSVTKVRSAPCPATTTAAPANQQG